MRLLSSLKSTKFLPDSLQVTNIDYFNVLIKFHGQVVKVTRFIGKYVIVGVPSLQNHKIF